MLNQNFTKKIDMWSILFDRVNRGLGVYLPPQPYARQIDGLPYILNVCKSSANIVFFKINICF